MFVPLPLGNFRIVVFSSLFVVSVTSEVKEMVLLSAEV